MPVYFLKRKSLWIFILIFFSISQVYSQSFPEKCIGEWRGKMYMFNNKKLVDSVDIILTVTKLQNENEFTWNTEYLSTKLPMVKDYIMRIPMDGSNKYILDEKDGIELFGYLFGNKMYFMFETSGIFLTSNYELNNDNLIFEVSSALKIDTDQEIINYSVNNLQRVVLKRYK